MIGNFETLRDIYAIERALLDGRLRRAAALSAARELAPAARIRHRPALVRLMQRVAWQRRALRGPVPAGRPARR